MRAPTRALAGPLSVLALTTLSLGSAPPPPATPAPTPPVPAAHAKDMARGREVFVHHVRPVLVEQCVKCHGGGRTRGGLDLTTREKLLKGGDSGPGVVPGRGKESRLYRLTAHTDEPHMPPTGPGLGKEQLAHLLSWIDLGAPYDRPLLDKAPPAPKSFAVTDDDRQFWSFRPLERPTPPSMPAALRGRLANPIDAFVLAKLGAKGLGFAPEASRRTLVRRLSFDLVGLPPTPEEVAAFLADDSPRAVEDLVDRLLASPRHGERWARHWLDVVRFAESHGFEHDYDRPTAYPYRDFVIRALNADLPYDTFTRWQIAGDEIAPADPLALTATGFLGAGVHSTQITAATVEKERYDELDDIVRTTGTAFLGLTVGCARCHDHKYDPVSMRDYYRLVATFTTTVRTEVELELDPAAAEAARIRHEAERARLEADLARYEKEKLPALFERWLADRPRNQSGWVVLEPTRATSSGGANLARQADGSFLVTGTNAAQDAYTFTAPITEKRLAGFRVEALAHPSMVRRGPGRAGNGNFALSKLSVAFTAPGASQPVPVKFVRARATFEQRGLPVAAVIDADPRSAWAIDPQFGKDHAAVFEPEAPVIVPAGSVLTVTLSFNNNGGHNIGRPRLAVTSTPGAAPVGDPVPAAVRLALSRLGSAPGATPTAAERAALLAWFRASEPGWLTLARPLDALRAKGPATGKTKALVCSEGLPAIRLHSQGADFLPQTHFLRRGDTNQKDGVATPGFLQVLTRTPEAEKRWQATPPPGWRTSYSRRALTSWLTDAEQGAGALLARVIANRLWHWHFGHGLVRTPSDFGLQGERPTHPELLDWLAGELIRSGWSLKHLHRLILTSHAYRQGNHAAGERPADDPDNRLLWRREPRRLEAEAVRDAILSISGQLDGRMFGPGTLDTRQPRRAVYFTTKRSQLIPLLTLFDAPDGNQGVESRPTTTIAPQALLLLNNDLVRASARAFAARLASLPADRQVHQAYGLALGRPPAPGELASAAAFLREQGAAYRDEKAADPDGRALADFCQVLLGLNEFIYID